MPLHPRSPAVPMIRMRIGEFIVPLRMKVHIKETLLVADAIIQVGVKS